MLAPGDKVPDFKLTTVDGEPFTSADLAGKRAVFCFFPFAFSGVCSDQFSLYQEVAQDFAAQGAELFGISCDARWSQGAFAEQLGLTNMTMLSDFEPKTAVSEQFGVRHAGGFSERAVFIVEPDGTISWSYLSPTLGEFPGPNVLIDALSAKVA